MKFGSPAPTPQSQGDIYAEETAINAIYHFPEETRSGAAKLTPQDFSNKKRSVVFATVSELTEEGKQPTDIAILQKFNGKSPISVPELAALTSGETAKASLRAFPDCVEYLLEKRRKREELATLKRVAGLAQRGDVSGVLREVAALDVREEPKIINPVLSCRDFIDKEHGSITPLIGSENDAPLVRGEGMFIPGQGGVGKTLFIIQMAINLTCGEYFLKWPVPHPCRVLISQAELPPQFLKKRLKAMFDSYALADPARAKMIGVNLFIEHVLQPFDIAAENGEGLDRLAETIEKLKIDVLIIDPFLSYFRGNENDNCEVRRALDQLKRQVAERCQCGLIVTDHQPKYSTADKFAEQKTAMRGAGAKRDWAASVLALAKMKTPEGQHGTFIQATIDKLRYGREPRNPFILRRDDLTFRHSLFKASSVELHEVARVLDEAGGGLSTRALWEKLTDSFSVAGHEARALVKNAIDAGWIETKPGEKRSTIHHLTIKYQEWRDGRN